MFEHFPYTNFHDMNMDWIIEVVKDFLDKYTYIEHLIETGKTDIINLTETEIIALTKKKEELETLLQAWYDSHSEDIARELTRAISEFVTAADNKAAQTIATIPSEYTELSDQVNGLQYEMDNIADIHKVTAYTTGGYNITYPLNIGDAIIVTNYSPASVEVRQRNSQGTVIQATTVLSGTSNRIVSTVNSSDIRFYFNEAGYVEFENAKLRLPEIERKVDNFENVPELIDFMTDYLFDSELIYHNKEYHTDTLNENVTIIELPVNINKKNYYFKVSEFVNINNSYPIGVEELDVNRKRLNITGRLQASFLEGTVIPISNPNTAIVNIYANVGANPKNTIKGLFIWESRTEEINRKPYPEFYVKKDGTGDFTRLVDAINKATRYMGAKVYLGPGTWDIIEELGDEYLSNVSGTQRGLYLKNRIHLICDSQSKIVANYTGNRNNVKTWLSIFNSGKYGFTLENATLEGSNIRYLIHDERDQDSDSYVNKYINCTMLFDNRNNNAWSAKQCIGGGLGKNGYIVIDGCIFRSHQGYDGTVSYHNTAASSGRSHIVVKDCYFYLYNTFRLSWYGTSHEITDAIVTNCYLGSDIVHRAENPSATTENTTITEWNNIINQHN